MRRHWLVLGSMGIVGCSALINLSDVNSDTSGNGGDGGNDAGGNGGRSGGGGTNTGGRGAEGGDVGADGGMAGGGAGNVPDLCVPNPCENEGTCTAEGDATTCVCVPPFTGEVCEVRDARSCLDLLRLGVVEDGVQSIDPDGPGGAPEFQAYCDMTQAGGGWTLVSSQLAGKVGYTRAWGTTSVRPTMPRPDAQYVLDFVSRRLDPGEVMMRHEDSGTAFVKTLLRDPYRSDADWEKPSDTATSLRRRVAARGQFLIFSNGVTTSGLEPDFYCVNNAMNPSMTPVNYNCDGASGQSNGQGLFNGTAFTQVGKCAMGEPIWKPFEGAVPAVPDPAKEVVCAPQGFITVWFREPARDCKELHDFLGVTTDGVYAIDPDGHDGQAPFNAYCDMTRKDGGWTLVAVNGLDGRPMSWKGNRYPRPGATFYGAVEQALTDVGVIAAGTVAPTIINYSIDAKQLYAGSGHEFVAFVGGTTKDFISATLPDGCNYFDGSTTCAENAGKVFRVLNSSGGRLTSLAQACTTANHEPPFEADPFDEFGLHILDGADPNDTYHCFTGATSSMLGNDPAARGRIYTTFNDSGQGMSTAISYWTRGVTSHWNAAGMASQPGFLMIR